MRIACGVEYDGRRFCGWQQQIGVRTVQPHVEAALSAVADHSVRVHCAGRTDTGVHASGQVVHMETNAERSMRSWVLGANVSLPRDVSILWARTVPDTFHARFSATLRSYRYVICNRPTRPGLWAGKVSWDFRVLDERKMAAGARFLIGEHDFSSFRAKGCQAKNPARTIRLLDVRRSGDFIVIDVEADAFLQHMVRNLAGVLATVGAGEQDADWVKHVLDCRDRASGGVTAPPDGLYLTRVQYPPEYKLPERKPNFPPV